MNVYSKTDIGLQREENQDTVWAEMLSETACAAVLCDGMGGEKAGGLASQMAVDIISKRIKESFSEMMNRNSVRNLLITAVVAANSIVYETAQKDIDRSVMGTTCVAAIVFGGCAYIVNVGDSRAYHLFSSEEDECIRQVTRDHSHVRELIERGEITEEQAKTHPKRNKITRAIGAESNVTPDYFELDLNDGDMLMLCSDGLSSYGDDMDILDICFEVKREDCVDALIRYANNNGGHDNVSVALIDV
ncbi:MAG: Stp1/IreP family PP2C-type Ser/Thr phosphatase [Oscillospiraceae bacterium]|nr:Stp1/IreP family PP2C-type Ser/Thr phosphatase [Oscillospiraceae bacterium]